MEISFHSHLNFNTVIATKFCTAVVACSKICCDLMASNGIMTRRSFHLIWIASKKPLVKRAPGLICLVKWIFELVFPNKINWRLYTCDHVFRRLVAIKLGVVWEGGGVCVCVCVRGVGVGVEAPPVLKKIVHNIYVFATGNLVAPPSGP